MVFPISQLSSFNIQENKELESLLCRIIYNGDSKELKTLISSGLDPDYKLSEEIKIDDKVFPKGSSLLYLIIYSSISSFCFWDHFVLLDILLEKGANIENSPGGGYTSVLEFSCANFNLMNEDILKLLITSHPSTLKAKQALKTICDANQRRFYEKVLARNSLSKCGCSEERLKEFILTGQEQELRRILDFGLDIDYIFSQDSSSSQGQSLLLFSLREYVEKRISEESAVNIIGLLLEKGADLNLECNEGNVLQFVCKNFNRMNQSLVSCILTSSTKAQVSLALQAIENEKERKDLLDMISNETVFQFDPEDSSELSLISKENVNYSKKEEDIIFLSDKEINLLKNFQKDLSSYFFEEEKDEDLKVVSYKNINLNQIEKKIRFYNLILGKRKIEFFYLYCG